MQKYKNHIIRNRFGKFDSQKEFEYFLLLLDRLNKGEIGDLRRQVKYELVPAQYDTVTVQLKTKKKERKVLVERACSYIADYVYTDARTGDTCVIDTKGVRTKEYIIKRKLMLYNKGIKVEEI